MSVYLKAARISKRSPGLGACLAICAASKRPYEKTNRHVVAFEELFSPRITGELVWGRLWDDARDECRVLALCLMAAIAGEEA